MSDKDTERLFIETPPVRLFFKAALPGAAGMLFSSLYYLLEGIIVGRVVGADAFAAFNLAVPFVIINFAVSDMIGVGSSVPIAIKLGKGEAEEADNIFSCSVLMIIIAGLLAGMALFAAAPAIFRLMGADDHLIPYAVSYLRVYAVFSPLTTLVYAVDNYQRICGRIRRSLLMNIILACSATALELLFVAVFGGGIGFAALGTCIGMTTAVLFGMYPFMRGRMALRFRRPRFSLPLLKTIVSCGLPTFLSNISGRVVSIIMNVILLSLGGATAVSVYGILMSADGVALPLLYGTFDSLQPSVGYNWGARRFDRVAAIERCCYATGAVVSLSLGALLFFFPGQVISLIVEGGLSSSVVAMGVPALRIFASVYLVRWIAVSTQCFMSAIGKPVFAGALSVSNAFAFPLIFLLTLYPMGLTGIWLNMPLTSLAVMAISLFILSRYRGIVRREKEDLG